MRAAARELEFERAAAIRDEIQSIRLRVLAEDESVKVARAAERAARGTPVGVGVGSRVDAAVAGGQGAGRVGAGSGPVLEVAAVEVVPVAEGDGLEEDAGAPAADWLPGIRDEHEDDEGWQARWLDRPTWDRSVTPNVRRRRGARPPRRGRGRVG